MRSDGKELLERAGEVVELARKAGAADAWVSAYKSHDVELQVRNGEVEKVKDSTSRGLSVRLYVDGRYSSNGTTDLRPEQLRSFVTEAVALTRALQPDSHRSIPDPALFRGRPEIDRLGLSDRGVTAIDRDRRLGWCQAMNERVAGKDRVISATSATSDGRVVVGAASSNGFTGLYEATSAGMYTDVTMRDDGDKRPESWYGSWARHVEDLADPARIADEALRRTRDRLGTAKGPTARTRMVVDNISAGSLIRRLLGPASGGAVQQKRSFWADRLGKPAVSELLTIVDDPLLPRGLGSRPFDDEGIAARRMPIIERGALQAYYLDTYYASKLGVAPTTGRPSNQVVSPGSRSLEQLIGDAGKGVYVTSWLGGNMDSNTGDFSLGVRGNLIENGKLGAPVGEMNVTGNVLGLFANLAALGNDPWPYSSVRAPSMLFDDVQFSGV